MHVHGEGRVGILAIGHIEYQYVPYEMNKAGSHGSNQLINYFIAQVSANKIANGEAFVRQQWSCPTSGGCTVSMRSRQSPCFMIS